jgi:5'-deoxynucleotidase YfbR-like HD superfamily hydrolase
MSDYIITYSHTKFYPVKPVKEDIHIEDIAHALSLMTRANGHFRCFYSVAQHSLNCYREAIGQGCSERIQLGCLLHDASESYISDITRPVKLHLPDYVAIEENLQNMIYDRFGLGDLSAEELRVMDEIDDVLLYYEFEALMGYPIFDSPPDKTADYDFSQRDYASVEKEYLSVFATLRR